MFVRIVPLSDRTGLPPASSLDDQARIEGLIADGLATRERDVGAAEALREMGEPWPAGHGLPGALLDERDADYREGRR